MSKIASGVAPSMSINFRAKNLTHLLVLADGRDAETPKGLGWARAGSARISPSLRSEKCTKIFPIVCWMFVLKHKVSTYLKSLLGGMGSWAGYKILGMIGRLLQAPILSLREIGLRIQNDRKNYPYPQFIFEHYNFQLDATNVYEQF